MDPDAIVWGLFFGLRHADKKFTAEKAEAMVEEHLKAGGRLSDLSNPIAEALQECGVFRFKKEDDRPT
jgi:hypothetical protein